MNTIGLEIVAGVGLFIIAMLIHELGHLKALRQHHPKAVITWDGKEFKVGEEWMYYNLTPSDYSDVFTAGIGIGLLPILGGLFLLNPWVVLGMATFYLWGSWSDIKALWRG